MSKQFSPDEATEEAFRLAALSGTIVLEPAEQQLLERISPPFLELAEAIGSNNIANAVRAEIAAGSLSTPDSKRFVWALLNVPLAPFRGRRAAAALQKRILTPLEGES